MSVILFPSEPRQAVVTRLEGLTDDEVQAVAVWRAANEILELTPVPVTLKNGARCVGVEDNIGRLKWTVCRERGELIVFDADADSDNVGDAIPRGASRVVESLWAALTQDDD